MFGRILTKHDSNDLEQKLLPVKDNTYALGMQLLDMPQNTHIHSMYRDARERLSKVIAEFLNQKKPTWRVLLNALKKSSSDDMKQLADILETNLSQQQKYSGIY